MGLRTRGEGGSLFVPHVNPLNFFLGSNCVSDSIQRVARQSVNSLNASIGEGLDQQLCNIHCHGNPPFFLPRRNSALRT
jgi:hypothetical protein